MGEAGFLTKGFERFRAEKEKFVKSEETLNAINGTADKNEETGNDNLDEVDTVLKVFNGTIVKDGRNDEY